MAIVKTKITEEEFMRLSDDGRKIELVDGEVKEVPAGGRHDALVAKLILMLGPFVKGLGYLFASQAGFRMASGNIRSPDVSFMRKERLPGGEPPESFVEGAPDLAIEILSPNEDYEELPRKLGEYFASGARQVWLMNPREKTISLYSSLTTMRKYGADEEIEGGDLLPGFKCRVAELFELG